MKPNRSQGDPILLQIPRNISVRAREKLHDLIDELLVVEEDAGAQMPTREVLIGRYVQMLRQRDPRMLKYVSTLAEAGELGSTLQAIRKGVGTDSHALGGISSVVTRLWHKVSSRKEAIIIKEHDRHYVRPDLLEALRRALNSD